MGGKHRVRPLGEELKRIEPYLDEIAKVVPSRVMRAIRTMISNGESRGVRIGDIGYEGRQKFRVVRVWRGYLMVKQEGIPPFIMYAERWKQRMYERPRYPQFVKPRRKPLAWNPTKLPEKPKTKREVRVQAALWLENDSLRLDDIREWRFTPIRPVDGETVVRLPSGVYVAVPIEADLRGYVDAEEKTENTDG